MLSKNKELVRVFILMSKSVKIEVNQTNFFFFFDISEIFYYTWYVECLKHIILEGAFYMTISSTRSSDEIAIIFCLLASMKLCRFRADVIKFFFFFL